VGEATYVILDTFPVPAKRSHLARGVALRPLLLRDLLCAFLSTFLLVQLCSTVFRFSDHNTMENFINTQWDTGAGWIDPRIFQTVQNPSFLPWNNNFSFIPQDHTSTTSSSTPDPSTSSDSRSDTPVETLQNPKSKKRRQRSESSQPDALIRPRKTRTLKDPQNTAKVREKGACLTCKRKRKEVGLICNSW
jgi:hypothetical protein